MKLASGGRDRLGSYKIMRQLLKYPEHIRAAKRIRGQLVRESCRAGNTQLLHLLLSRLSVAPADLIIKTGKVRLKPRGNRSMDRCRRQWFYT